MQLFQGDFIFILKLATITNTLALIITILRMLFPIVVSLVGMSGIGIGFGIDDMRYLDLKWTVTTSLPIFIVLLINELAFLVVLSKLLK